MRLNLCIAAWLVVALGGACRSRALPVPDGGPASTAGSAGTGTGIPDPLGGGGTGGAARGDAGLGGAGGGAGTTGDAGLGGAGGVAGMAGDPGLGGAGAATGGAGLGGSAGGAAGAAGGPAVLPECSPETTTGQPCVVGSVCNQVECGACSDRYWRRLVGLRPCACDPTGVWACTPAPPGHSVDCFFDPPLDCALAQLLYEDATCQTHPPCSTSTPP